MIVGIDLGTTNSLVAVWRDGSSELVTNALGETLTPSVVGLDDDGQILPRCQDSCRLSGFS
ncbi:Chaperone protein HscC [Pseudomonas syringae pv. actinidiae]|nr:Chaperone protein HscC [Pseudomonas syringae pv. actinidiae]